MKKLVTACLASSAVLASSTALAADKFELNGDAAKGAATYKTFCESCHGPNGDGKGPAGVVLKPPPTSFGDPANAQRLTPEWVYRIIVDGGAAHGKSPLMVSWKAAIKDPDIRNVAAYVLKFKHVPPAKKPGKK